MARAIVLLCCLVVIIPMTSPAATLTEQLEKWGEGKRIQVVCTNGDKIIGRLGNVAPDGFILNPDKKGAGLPREIRFAEVRSVKSKWTTGEKWLLGGLIYVGLTILSAVTLGN